MSDKKKIGFWIGKGTLGPGIKHGDPIVEGVISSATIEAQKKLGNIQESEISEAAAQNVTTAEALLKESNAEIKALNDLVDSQKKEIDAKDKEIESLKSESEESLKAEIKTLNAEKKKLEKDAKK